MILDSARRQGTMTKPYHHPSPLLKFASLGMFAGRFERILVPTHESLRSHVC